MGASFFGLVPAAGCGARMNAPCPKQYLDIAGHPMIYHAIRGLLASARVHSVFVVLAANDEWWDGFDWQDFADRLTVLRCGGATRADSVANGLAAMSVADDDWVLVHDAARPGLTGALVDTLIASVENDPVGGLLAIPVADTLKRAAGYRVASTQSRDGLWQAQTPQMFRRGLLLHALDGRHHDVLTDEASAIEALGMSPLLVPSRSSNFKVTFAEDLALARAMLALSSLHGDCSG